MLNHPLHRLGSISPEDFSKRLRQRRAFLQLGRVLRSPSSRQGGKIDAEGQGRVAYLSRETVKWLRVWLENAEISEGAVFRRLIGQIHVGGPLNPGSIAPIFKRVARWIGIPERVVNQVSGHSTRVGATQYLAALDIDLAAITQAGGWKSTRMPLQYAEEINVATSGMARAAAGRDAPVSE
jgi:integrase